MSRRSAAVTSHIQDGTTDNGIDQVQKFNRRERLRDFSDRLREAMGSRSAASIARATAIPAQTLDGYLKGSIPSGDRLLALAEALGVTPQWLLWREGPRAAPEVDALTPEDAVIVPRYDLSDVHEHGKGQPRDKVPLPLDWVLPVARNAAGLWIVEVPDGPAYLCRNPETQDLVSGRRYLLLLSGRPLIARVRVQKGGLELAPDDDEGGAVFLAGDDSDQLVVVGRVLAQIALSPA